MSSTGSKGGWKPKPGARIRLRLLPTLHVLDDTPPPPGGVWAVIDRAPGHMRWWVKAIDLEAQSWAAAHPGEIVSGCKDVHDREMDPINSARI